MNDQRLITSNREAILIAMSSAEAEAYFANEFEKDLLAVGADVLQRYRPVLKAYKEIIIPF